MDGHLACRGMNSFLPNLRSQGIEHASCPDYQGIPMEALHPMEPQTYVAGDIQPQGYVPLAPLERVSIGQVLEDPPLIYVLEELSLGSFARNLNVVNLP